jgi:hypothetical protein
VLICTARWLGSAPLSRPKAGFFGVIRHPNSRHSISGGDTCSLAAMNRAFAVLIAFALPTAAIAGEPLGLRSAIAEHFRAQAERSNRHYHARIRAADLSSYDFVYALTDLNGGGIQDAIVLLKGDYCGSGGCTLQIYRGTHHGFAFVSSSTSSRESIRILPEMRFGWHSFTIFVSGRGAKPSNMQLRRGRKHSSQKGALVG